MSGTQQVTPREIRGVMDQLMSRLDSKNGPKNLVEIRRALAGREARLLSTFIPTIGEIEGENLLALIWGQETKDDPLVREMVMHISPTPTPHYVHAKAISVRELGLDVDGMSLATYDQIWAAAQANGVRVKTPAAVAPSMLRCILRERDHHFHRVVKGFENLYFLMEPMNCSDGSRRIFRMGYGHIPHRLTAYHHFLWSRPVDNSWFTGDEFFVVVEKLGKPEDWAADRAKLES